MLTFAAAAALTLLLIITNHRNWRSWRNTTPPTSPRQWLPRRKTKTPPPHFADITHQVATLISAGVPDTAAWQTTLHHTPTTNHAATTALATHLATAPNIATGLKTFTTNHNTPYAHQTWLIEATAVSWHVSATIGAPLSTYLHHIVTIANHIDDTLNQAKTAFAGPKATLQLLAALPILGYLMAYAMGANPLHYLATTPIGWALTATGTTLIITTIITVRWLLRRAGIGTTTPPINPQQFLPDLVACGLHSGSPPTRILTVIAAGCADLPTWRTTHNDTVTMLRHQQLGSTWTHIANLPNLSPGATTVAHCLSLAEHTGAPAANILTAQAHRTHTTAMQHAKQRANALSVQLVIPLGALALPAFFTLVLAPTILDLITTTLTN